MFASDNASAAHPKILQAIIDANTGHAPSYGGDAWTLRAEAAVREVFERDCTLHLVSTGTAANALSLAALTPPWGAVITHPQAHIVNDEGGAAEFFMGGAKVLHVDGPHGKITPEALHTEASKYGRRLVHGAQPHTVSISNATECGAVYSAREVGALAEAARGHGLKLHMDGARFANAVVATGASPADLSWRAGVDVLSLGATKNGVLSMCAIICFEPGAATQLPHLCKRSGHLLSKHRFLGAQMAAYIENGLWLDMAGHANAMARALADVLAPKGEGLMHPVEANEVFAALTKKQAGALRAIGAAFHPWPADGDDVFRFVTSWSTTMAEIDRCRMALAAL